MDKGEQWEKIKVIAGAAMECEAAQRESFVRRSCGEDASLRAEVQSLLSAYDSSERLSESPINTVLFESPAAAKLLGPYQLVQKLGEGGMGQVWLAEQNEPVRRRVAVKLIKGGMYDDSAIRRFQAERQSLATMDHPSIAKVFDAGATAEGQPYFVMEYVPGISILEYCDKNKIKIRERLELFTRLCEGVQHAHQKAIIHRDLKPANILVVEVDGRPVPRIIDFGLAKSVAPFLTGDSFNTLAGAFVGTPGYMSPEQADPGVLDIDTRTDVYSLGVILYELLTGYLPFDTSRWKKKMRLEEALKWLREEDPPKPSTRVHAHEEASQAKAEARGTEPGHLIRQLRGDLDWMALKAIEKDRSRRYGAPSELAADIQRHLNNEAVSARPASSTYRARKFVRRHWLGAAATTAVLLALLTGIGVATWQARRAERRFAQVRHLANVFLFDFEQSIHNVPGTTKARQLLVKTALEYLQSLSKDASGDPTLTEELAAAYEKVGDILGGSNIGNVGNSAEAVRSYEQATSLRTSLKNTRPQNIVNLLALVKLLDKLDAVQARTGDVDGALRSSQLAVAQAETLLQARPGDHQVQEQLAYAYMDLAFMEIRRTKMESAQRYANQAIELLEPLAVAAPQERDAQLALAKAYWSMGSLLERTSQVDEAEGFFAKALPLYEKLVADEPGDRDTRRRMTITLSGLGTMQAFSKTSSPVTVESGIAESRRAVEIASEAVSADPANAEAVSDLVAMSTRLGASLASLGRYKEANQALEGALHAAKELVARDPENMESRLSLGQIHVWLGTNMAKSKDIAGALRERQVAADIFEKLALDSPGDRKVLDPQVWNWLMIGDLLAGQHDWERSRHYYALGMQVAKPLATQNPSFMYTFGELQKSDQQAAQALAAGVRKRGR